MLGTECTTIRAAIKDIAGNARIGMRMRELRKAAGLTQEEVAVRMGCKQKDISRWEAGRPISASHAYFFCKAVGCSLGSFDDL